MSVLVAMFGLLGPRAVAAPAPAAAAARMDWLDHFITLAQDMIWLMGGDAQDLDRSSPDTAMSSFRQSCAGLNVPQDLSESDRAELLALANEMDALLDEPPGNASSNEVDLTESTVSRIRLGISSLAGRRSSP